MTNDPTNDSPQPDPPEEATTPGSPATSEEGLPPVAPPSGRFIIQLFLVPGLIVAVVVCVLIGIERFLGRGRSAESYLSDLASENPHVRWRAAADLSQELPQNPELAGNVAFAQALAQRLEKGISGNDGLARSLLQNWWQAPKSQREDFNEDREFVKYLTTSQGHLLTPMGLTVLCQLAKTEKFDATLDPKLLEPGQNPEEQKKKAEEAKNAKEFKRKLIQERRHTAVYSLALLGGSLNKYRRLPDREKQAILQSLEQRAAQANPESVWAKTALDLLRSGKSESAEVADALTLTARGPDPMLRLFSANALYFWEGPGVDKTLEEMLSDDGHGAELLDRNPEMGERSKQEFQYGIRYQAAAALAAHGSPRIEDHLDVLKEMMNEKLLREHAIVTNRNNQKVTSTDLAVAPTYLVLKALRDLHAKKPGIAKTLLPEVERLTNSENQKIRSDAQELVKLLKKK